MKLVNVMSVSILIVLCSVNVFAKEKECKANPSDYMAIKSVVKKNKNMGRVVKVFCPEIIENYATAVFDNNSDGGSVYLVKTNGKWNILNFGTMISDEDLLEFGVPQNIAEKLVD